MISQVSKASQEIDSIVKGLRDWRGVTLARLRASIRRASPSVVEDVKWKKPSNPAGVPVWSQDGIVCIGDALKNSVRLTFRPVEQSHVAGPTVREFPGCLLATDLVHAACRERLLVAVYSEDHNCLLIELTMRGPGERNQRSGLNQTPIQRQRPAGSPGR